MEELNLTDLIQYYTKKLPIIILAILLAISLGYVYITFIQVPMYHGTTTINLLQQSDSSQTDAVTQAELAVNEKLVYTYSEIIKSRKVLTQVIKELNLDFTIKELADRINVTSVTNTSIIQVTVSDESSDKAVQIANKVANVFKNEITDMYNLENVFILDEAIVEDKPYNVNVIKQMAIYILISIVISCAIIFVIYYFDNTIKSKKEIEEIIKLPVLGEIPTISRRKFNSQRGANTPSYKSEVGSGFDNDIAIKEGSLNKKYSSDFEDSDEDFYGDSVIRTRRGEK